MTKATEPAKAQEPSHKGIPTKPRRGRVRLVGGFVGWFWLVGWLDDGFFARKKGEVVDICHK